MAEEEDLKIVLNVRNPKLISLLEQIKDNTGINYQNTIKFGLLLLFQDEIRKIKNFQASQEQEEGQVKEKEQVKKDEEKIEKPSAAGFKTPIQEGFGGLLKVHITFVGKLKHAIDIWKYRTGKSYQDISRQGLDKIFSFFNQQEESKPFVQIKEEKKNKKLGDFLNKKDTLLGFLNG